MFDRINKMFDVNQNILNIYEKRQEILASNIANSETIGYKSIDINFENELNKILNDKKIRSFQVVLNKTSPKHFDSTTNNTLISNIKPQSNNQKKINKNTVDMNVERIKFLENSVKYQSSLVFIKNDIQNITSVLQG